MTSPSPSNVGNEVEEETSRATKPVKAEAGDDGAGAGALINIKVKSQTADDVFFRVKRDVKLRRLMDMYCGKHSLDPKAVLFLNLDGGYIRRDQTPDEIGLQDGDAIDIMLTQLGGGEREPESCMKADALRVG